MSYLEYNYTTSTQKGESFKEVGRYNHEYINYRRYGMIPSIYLIMITPLSIYPWMIINQRLNFVPHYMKIFEEVLGRVPAQDVHFFYMRSRLSALQNCALLFSINFQFIFIFKECITQFSHWIVSCIIVFKNIAKVFIKFTHSFVAIELLTFCKNSKKNLLLRESSHYFG